MYTVCNSELRDVITVHIHYIAINSEHQKFNSITLYEDNTKYTTLGTSESGLTDVY